jgi:heterodisulfide reductase subunit C
MNDDIVEFVREVSAQNPFSCYQCGKCTAGCPVAAEMDAPPNRVLRMLQFNDPDLMTIASPWECVTCVVCTVRCPRNIDIAKIMEAIRQYRQRGREDYVHPNAVDVADLPQIAMVSAFRKLGEW